MSVKQQYIPGLEGVIACETDISYLDVEQESIVIRGYDLIELCKTVSYLDLVYLLLYERLPNDSDRDTLNKTIAQEARIPDEVFQMLKLFPENLEAMDGLRTSISALAGYEPELDDCSREANQRKTLRLLAKVPIIVANLYRARTGQEWVLPNPDLNYPGNFLYMITGKNPTWLEERIYEQLLMSYSEHEMPNSTFAARIIASTTSDLYGALTGAVASLKGKLHGGANEAVMEMLLEAETEEGLETLMLTKLSNKERIMGFGHRVYMKKMDPRAQLMKEALEELSREKGNHQLYEMCVRGEELMKKEKGLYPNLDYYAAPVYYLLGIPIELYTPIFLSARIIGIGSHVMEQHENNRLFRPRVNYRGPRNLHV